MSIKKMITYRDVWMGAAMLWVMLYHSGIDLYINQLNFIKGIGYGGVDVFIFASGVGNYYSYMRDTEPLSFMQRRLKRLLPSYIPFILVWCLVEAIHSNLSLTEIIGNIFMVQGFSIRGISFNWYITLLLLCYTLTPYLATYIDGHGIKKNLILICLILLISTVFWKDGKFIVTATRLPIYVIGMLAAKYSDKTIERKHIIIGTVLFLFNVALLYLLHKYSEEVIWDYGLFWYPFIFIAPFFCYVISVICAFIEAGKIKTPIVIKGLKTIGLYSFELYLIHSYLFNYIKLFLPKLGLIVNNLLWIIICVAIFGASIVLKKISDKVAQYI